MKILVVDDDEVVRRVCRATLEHLATISEASDGDDAVRMLCNELFDLVITDFRMPMFDGLKLLDYIKLSALDTAVILITAHANEDLAISAVNKQAYGFLKKPFSPEEIRALASQALMDRLQARAQFEQRMIEHRRKIAGMVFALGDDVFKGKL